MRELVSALRLLSKISMDKETFDLIKETYKNKENPNHDIIEKLNTKVNPFIRQVIQKIVEKRIPERDDTYLRNRFLKLDSSEAYLNDLIVTFLQFAGQEMRSHQFVKTFIAPFSDMSTYLILIYKCMVLCIVSLIYNKQEWSLDDIFCLEQMILNYKEGKNEAVRTFLSEVVEQQVPPTEYERFSSKPVLFSNVNWGPMFWRVIHFMAESVALRNHHEAKKHWRSFLITVFHNLLMCGMCDVHYSNIVEKYKSDITNIPDAEFPDLWFKLHNEINRTTYDQFEEDRKLMQKALLRY